MKKQDVAVNPFFEIAHKGDEDVILDERSLDKIKTLADELVKEHKIVFVVGEPGSGKSLVEKEIESHIPKKFKIKKYDFTMDLGKELKAVPIEETMNKNLILFIDKFELSEVMSDDVLRQILKQIFETSESGVGYVITCTPNTLSRIFELSYDIKSGAKVYNTPKLTFEQAKKLVISRLNSVRTKKYNSVSPFTDNQIKSIWNTSNGNPKMILLLCGTLYDTLRS